MGICCNVYIRLAIASVLALEPDVLFLDEPIALLDEEGTKLVWDTIREIGAEKTLVIVEHKISGILDFVDRLIVIAPDGELLADGPPQEVFQVCKQQMMDYGIWYPGVWDDFRLDASAISVTQTSAPVMTFRDFSGTRGGQIKTSVDNLSVYPGDWVTVVGPNGAGKSSLLLAIMRLIPTHGSCWIAGVKGNKVEQLAERVGFVFQNPEFQFVRIRWKKSLPTPCRRISRGAKRSGQRSTRCLVNTTCLRCARGIRSSCRWARSAG